MVNQFGVCTGGGGSGGGDGSTQIDIALTGTTAQTVGVKLFGAYHVSVESTIPGAPTFTCDVTKRTATDVLFFKNVMAYPAGDGCAIGVAWPSNGYLQVSKSLASYNGIYTVVLIGLP